MLFLGTMISSHIIKHSSEIHRLQYLASTRSEKKLDIHHQSFIVSDVVKSRRHIRKLHQHWRGLNESISGEILLYQSFVGFNVSF